MSPSPDEIILHLSDPHRSDRRQMILEAEVTAFDETQTALLIPALKSFVRTFRNSNDWVDLVAVGSAIRKLVFNVRPDDLEELTEILDPSQSVSIPLSVELEFAKSVVHVLINHPQLDDDAFPSLADQLVDLVRTYATPRMLPREKHGATALNAVLAIFLLRSTHTDFVLSWLTEHYVRWFVELVVRRSKRIAARLKDRFPEEHSVYAKDLLAAINQLENIPRSAEVVRV